MTSRGKKRRANRARGNLQGAKDTLSGVRAKAGLVLTRAGEDIPLDPDSTIDLVDEAQKQGRATPSFSTRKADPMRAFTSGGVAGEGQVLQKIGDDTSSMLEELRQPGESDNALLERLLDQGKLAHGSELHRLVSRDMASFDPALRAAAKFNTAPATLEEAIRVPVDFIDDGRSIALKKIIKDMNTPARYGFLKRHLLEMVASNDLEHVAAGMSFVRSVLDPVSASHLAEEVLAAAPKTFNVKVEGPGGIQLDREVDRAVADQIVGAMKPLRQDQRSRVLQGLNERFPGIVPDRIPLNQIPPEYRGASKIVVQEMKEMATDPKLQRLGESCFHKCVEAWKNDTLIVPNRTALPEDMKHEAGEKWFEGAQVFVVNHNWASAFKNSAEFAEGAWHLPYARTVFEFRISGHRCALALIVGHEYDKDKSALDLRPLHGVFNVETSAGWVLGSVVRFTEDGRHEISLKNMPEQFYAMHGVCALACQQARAICITLEAQVAVTEVVRAPHKLNQKRERAGKLPIFDYHVVDLAHRKRYAARLPESGDQEVEHARKRLHWVRAHTRHYPNHKVQIKWHLRGDPDLGFVDKEYRL